MDGYLRQRVFWNEVFLKRCDATNNGSDNCTYNLNRTERAFIIIVVTVTDAFASALRRVRI